MNRFTEYDDIKNFLMPANTKVWMKIYLEGGKGYQPRDKKLLAHLWDSKDTPGFQKFIKAMASGNTREYNNWVLAQEQVSGKKRGGTEYG